ncbi:MAG: hypothetical protein GXX99_05655 [Clostridiales bacterium]|nr:hypothetical protein [Clostridiales bacterium]
MLQLLFGTADSDREERLFSLLKQREGLRRCLLIVPEQFSLTAERHLLERFGDGLPLWLEVLSFRRLPDYVFRRLGGRNRRLLTDGGARILLSGAVEATRPHLRHYQNAALKPDFIEQLKRQFDEFSAQCVDPDDLRRLCGDLPDAELGDKLCDLSLLYAAYLARIGEGALCAQFALDAAVELLWEHNIFDRTDVFITHFKGFTPQELSAVERMLASGSEVTVSLLADPFGDAEGVFSAALHTAERLRQLAQEVGCGLKPDLCAAQRPDLPAELHHLERQFLRPNPNPFEGAPEALTLLRADSHYDELCCVAAEICRLVRSEGYRWRDVAVVVRQAPPDPALLEAVFAKFGIPVQLDRRVELTSKPLVMLIFAAFSCVLGGFAYEDVFTYLKTGLAGLPIEKVDHLENYAYAWDISRGGWRRPFALHPDGAEGRFDQRARARLADLETMRRQAVDPLLRFERDIAQGGALAISTAVHRLLEQLGAEQILAQAIERCRADGREAEALEYEQVWEAVATLLEQMAALAEPGISPRRYVELLRIAAAQTRLGVIPATVDQVMVLGTDRLLPRSVRCAFVLDFCADRFPMLLSAESLLSEQERGLLRLHDLRLAQEAAQSALDEQHYAYLALTAPTDRLVVTYALDQAGQTCRPSPYLQNLLQLFPGLTALDAGPLLADPAALQSEGQAFDRLLALDERDPLAEALFAHFSKDPAQRARIEAVRAACDRGRSAPSRLHAPALRRLYGPAGSLSPTSLERFTLCNFSYFCQYGLRLRPRRKSELDALQVGSFMHEVLETFFGRAGPDFAERLSPADIAPLVEEAVEQYKARHLPDLAERPARFAYLFSRLNRILCDYLLLLIEEFKNSDFRPLDLELAVGRDIPPLRYGEGEQAVVVTGRVDRVDGYRKDGALYLRVVDYKTGLRQLEYGELYQGIGLQMLLYLSALLQNGQQRYGENLLPAGVVYAPVRLDIVSADDRAIDDEALQRERKKLIRRNGLLLDREEVLLAMDRSGRFQHLPVSARERDGVLQIDRRGSSLASLEELGALQVYIEQLLRDTAQALQQGQVSVNPIRDRRRAGVDACRFCDMAPVCRWEGEERTPAALSAADFWRAVLRQAAAREGEHGQV